MWKAEYSRLVALIASIVSVVSGTDVDAGVVLVPSEYADIQTGLNIADSGDTVLVAAGVYTGPSNRNLDYLGKNLVLLSEAGPALTVIDCEQQSHGVWIHSGEGLGAILDGFTIRNAGGPGSPASGVRIESSSPTIRNVHVQGSERSGFYIAYSTVTLQDVRIESNTNDWFGGGIRSVSSNLILEDSYIGGNDAAWGGGLAASSSSVQIVNCDFRGNQSWNDGAAIYMRIGGALSAKNTVVVRNESSIDGGAMYIEGDCQAEFENVTLAENTAGRTGGAVVLDNTAHVEFRDCLFISNQASSEVACLLLRGDSHVRVEGCTLLYNVVSANEIGTIALLSTVPSHFERNIIAFNPGIGLYLGNWSAAPTFACNDVFGNGGGDYEGAMEDLTGQDGNISADPLLCLDLNPGHPFSLQPGSPCLPEHNDCGQLIGAYGLGCSPTQVEDSSLSAIKSLY